MLRTLAVVGNRFAIFELVIRIYLRQENNMAAYFIQTQATKLGLT